MQEKLFKVRDKRQRGWFWLDQEYFNGYARIFGPIGLSVYLSLCRHADNETQECWPSMELIAEEIGVGRMSVVRYIKKLEEYRIISVKREKNPVNNHQLNNVYTLTDKTEWKEKPSTTELHGNPGTTQSKPGYQKKPKPSTTVVQELDSINYTHLNKTQEAAQSAEVAEIINLFKVVNPSYTRLFAMPPQRAAVARLLKTHGREKLTSMINFLPRSNNMDYVPIVTTPCQLEDKMGQLVAALQKVKNKTPVLL